MLSSSVCRVCLLHYTENGTTSELLLRLMTRSQPDISLSLMHSSKLTGKQCTKLQPPSSTLHHIHLPRHPLERRMRVFQVVQQPERVHRIGGEERGRRALHVEHHGRDGRVPRL